MRTARASSMAGPRYLPDRKDMQMAGPEFIYVMKALTKVVPPNRVILKDIWLSFYPGAKIGVVGANGSGKSSLLRIMAGLDKDFNGEAWAAAARTCATEASSCASRSSTTASWIRPMVKGPLLMLVVPLSRGGRD